MPARKPPDGPSYDNLMLIVGQLLEATKAATDGLKSVSVDVQNNAKAILSLAQTVKMVDEKTAELNKLVCDATYPNNLVITAQGHTIELMALRTAVADLQKAVTELKADLSKLSTTVTKSDAQATTHKNIIWSVIKGVAWIVTTAVAVYAAITGK